MYISIKYECLYKESTNVYINKVRMYIYLLSCFFSVKHQLNHVYCLMRIESSETICINKYEN